jgi:hypothetical protein
MWPALGAVGSVVARLVAAGVTGVAAAIVYPLVQGIVVEPVNALRDALRELDATLADTARRWANPPQGEEARRLEGTPALEPILKESDQLRASVSRLTAASNAVRFERLWTATRVIPSRADVQEASALLTRVCNQFAIRVGPPPGEVFPGDQNRNDVIAARALLRLPPVPWLPERTKRSA